MSDANDPRHADPEGWERRQRARRKPTELKYDPLPTATVHARVYQGRLCILHNTFEYPNGRVEARIVFADQLDEPIVAQVIHAIPLEEYKKLPIYKVHNLAEDKNGG